MCFHYTDPVIAAALAADRHRRFVAEATHARRLNALALANRGTRKGWRRVPVLPSRVLLWTARWGRRVVGYQNAHRALSSQV